jgi:undecaprenyl-diphosphatase
MLVDVLRQLLLTVLQGVTEVFPVSSSAHLVVYGRILGSQLSLNDILFFHLGTFLAILWFYRTDVLDLTLGRAGWRLPGLMIVSFISTAAVGIVVKETLADALVNDPYMVSLLWTVNGILVILIGVRCKPGSKQLQNLTVKEFVLIGIAQGIAAMPGISRLGMTIGVGLLQKLSWQESVKLSFLLSLPTILLANLYVLALHEFSPTATAVAVPHGQATFPGIIVILLTLATGLFGLYILRRLLFLGRRLLFFFGMYCIASGLFFSLYLDLF